MTLSHLEQTNRAIKKATREVAAREHLYGEIEEGANLEPPLPPTDDQIVEAVEEHIGWDFDRRERHLALRTWRKLARADTSVQS